MIENVTAQLPHHATKKYSTRLLNEIDTLVIHQTDGEDDGDLSPWRTASYHVNSKDWPGIAYHYMIIDSGKSFQINELESISYHAGNENTNSVGIVITGKHRFDPDKTNSEIAGKRKYYSLVKTISEVKRKLPNKVKIVSHESLSDQRSDPNLDMDKLRSDVKKYDIARLAVYAILVGCITALIYKYRKQIFSRN
jgi:hypothetical protein